MYGIRIRTIGEVAFQSRMKMSSGYRCDVPVDHLGFPCLPLTEMMKDTPIPVPGVQIGFAHPEGYMGLVREASDLEERFPNDRELIRALYVSEHFDKERGTYIRALKSGQSFVAPIRCRKEDTEGISSFLRTVKRIGMTEEGITGEVELKLCELDGETGAAFPLNRLCSYTLLEYAVHLITPACLYAPYEDGTSTYLYLPGAEVRKELESLSENEAFSGMLEEMTFTHATISGEGKRLIPVPLCMSVVKLDPEQLHCRLSTGKDPSRIEQEVTLTNAYTADFRKHFMRYTKPVTERISTRDGSLCDALQAGQAFRGIVYGTDEQIRALAGFIREHPYFSIGKATDEGYGGAYLEICSAEEEAIRTEDPAVCFDVVCVSDTLLLNDEGMPSCHAEDLLREIEEHLGIPGGLDIIGKYTDVYRDFHYCPGREQDGPVIRCLKAGSVIRVRTRNGKPVDLFPVRHCFVGENTKNGYGEISVCSAGNLYYRVAEQVAPPQYTMEMPMSYVKAQQGASLILSALKEKLKSVVRALAILDRSEYRKGVPLRKLIPTDLLQMMTETYAPELDPEIAAQWYWEGLEDEQDV